MLVVVGCWLLVVRVCLLLVLVDCCLCVVCVLFVVGSLLLVIGC